MSWHLGVSDVLALHREGRPIRYVVPAFPLDFVGSLSFEMSISLDENFKGVHGEPGVVIKRPACRAQVRSWECFGFRTT